MAPLAILLPFPHFNHVIVLGLHTEFLGCYSPTLKIILQLQSSGMISGLHDFQIAGSSSLSLLAKPLDWGIWLSQDHTPTPLSGFWMWLVQGLLWLHNWVGLPTPFTLI